MTWISTKKKWPELNKEVMMWGPELGYQIGEVDGSDKPVGKGYREISLFKDPPAFTHWMPLPKPPRVKK